MATAVCTLSAQPRHPNLSARIREVLERQGWEVESEGVALVAREDATRLCCVESPATVTVDVLPDVLEIQVTVPGGRGPISSRDARRHLLSVARTVVKANRT